MPYVSKRVRQYFAGFIPTLATPTPYVESAGELTYRLTKECLEYAEVGTHNESYQKHCEVIGALFCTALEYYRRALAPYEDRKIEENGDVYPG